MQLLFLQQSGQQNTNRKQLLYVLPGMFVLFCTVSICWAVPGTAALGSAPAGHALGSSHSAAQHSRARRSRGCQLTRRGLQRRQELLMYRMRLRRVLHHRDLCFWQTGTGSTNLHHVTRQLLVNLRRAGHPRCVAGHLERLLHVVLVQVHAGQVVSIVPHTPVIVQDRLDLHIR